MSEKANAALTVGFLALIILIFTVADVISGDKTFSETENRILASRPELTVEAIFDGTYMEDYETYVTDQIIVLSQINPVDALLLHEDIRPGLELYPGISCDELIRHIGLIIFHICAVKYGFHGQLRP